MADKIEYSRLLLKRTGNSGIQPTMSTGTTLNELSTTDLLNGEMFLNTSDEKAFVRLGANIREFNLIPSGSTSFDFCSTGLQTSAISGCSAVEIFDDFNFQSQKNITTSNGDGKIELDESGNANMMKFGVSGASRQDFLQIDPNFNGLFGTSLTSYDSDFNRFSQFYCDPNSTIQASTDNNTTYTTGVQSAYDAFNQKATASLQSFNLGGVAEAEILTTVSLATDTSKIDINADVIAVSNISFNGGTSKWVFKELNIGNWNMTGATNVSVNHGLSLTEWQTIRDLSGVIRRDDDASYFGIPSMGANFGVVTNPAPAYINIISSTVIGITRLAGDVFDSATFSSSPFNRGFVTFWYKPD